MSSNSIVLAILNSPAHGMVSGSMMALAFTGRKSGKAYTLPVDYLREHIPGGGARIWTLSQRDRTWWRNFRGGAPATLTLQRKPVPATGYLVEEPAAVADALAHCIEMSAGTARLTHVQVENGVIDAASLQAAAQVRVLVYFDISEVAAADKVQGEGK